MFIVIYINVIFFLVAYKKYISKVCKDNKLVIYNTIKKIFFFYLISFLLLLNFINKIKKRDDKFN